MVCKDSRFIFLLHVIFIFIVNLMHSICIKISFDLILHPLLPPEKRGQQIICHHLNRLPSIKDLIESFRVPHPEVGRITVNLQEVDFGYRVRDGDAIQVSPLTPPIDPLAPHLLRPEPLPKIRFLVDVNVGKLCSLLRMAGFDTLYFPKEEDDQLADIAVREKCVLLSRDIGLLKRKKIVHGHYIRSQDPTAQLAEVVELYDLKQNLKPFSRCMRCNEMLVSVKKEKVKEQLEPLTRKYYTSFYQCSGCAQIYWSGSHKEGMQDLLDSIL